MLTKTQQTLLDAARTNAGRYTVVKAHGRRATGGKVDAGNREYRAAIALEKLGLVKVDFQETDKETLSGNTIIYQILGFSVV